MKYFRNIQSFEDLKKRFRELLKVNHPDNGGDVEVMKMINVEFDALFPIWKNRTEKETGKTINETASSTRKRFYTENGWEGSRYDCNLSLKEIAKIVRTYVKEKYPTYKFSVRTSYASMCQELHVELKESPIDIYKPFEDLTWDDLNDISKALYMWRDDDRIVFLNATREEQRKMIEESTNRNARVLNEITQAVVDDVDAFVKSYNYEDWDGMIDYFDVDFYYFGCLKDNGADIKIVPKTARIKNKSGKPSKVAKAPESEVSEPERLEQKSGYTYEIKEDTDTRDGSRLWVVRILEKLDKAAYTAENRAMKERGGYYSKFKHGFIFRFDPAEILNVA